MRFITLSGSVVMQILEVILEREICDPTLICVGEALVGAVIAAVTRVLGVRQWRGASPRLPTPSGSPPRRTHRWPQWQAPGALRNRHLIILGTQAVASVTLCKTVRLK